MNSNHFLSINLVLVLQMLSSSVFADGILPPRQRPFAPILNEGVRGGNCDGLTEDECAFLNHDYSYNLRKSTHTNGERGQVIFTDPKNTVFAVRIRLEDEREVCKSQKRPYVKYANTFSYLEWGEASQTLAAKPGLSLVFFGVEEAQRPISASERARLVGEVRKAKTNEAYLEALTALEAATYYVETPRCKFAWEVLSSSNLDGTLPAEFTYIRTDDPMSPIGGIMLEVQKR